MCTKATATQNGKSKTILLVAIQDNTVQGSRKQSKTTHHIPCGDPMQFPDQVQESPECSFKVSHREPLRGARARRAHGVRYSGGRTKKLADLDSPTRAKKSVSQGV